tara:strand:+ start:49 stop:324 length:276 start_codon:yes stop_codon:yes gene_type:complete
MDFLEDLELYNEAMLNAYNVITKKISIDDVFVELEEEDGKEEELREFPLPFNPFLHEDISNEEIDSVIEHFSDLEEYEMCAELVSCKKDVK